MGKFGHRYPEGISKIVETNEILIKSLGKMMMGGTIMNLKQLEYFSVVAQYGSINKAAWFRMSIKDSIVWENLVIDTRKVFPDRSCLWNNPCSWFISPRIF